MTREERENSLHCLKVMIEEANCEECNLYGTTGTDHCERDCVRNAIQALEQERSRSAEIAQYRHDCEKLMEENERLKKVLEQEPCEDPISRQAVLEQTYLWSKDEFLRVTNPFDYLRKRINSLPSVKPQYTEAEIQMIQALEQAEIQKAYELGKGEGSSEWIPVSERLPEKNEWVLVTFKMANGENSIDIKRINQWSNKWEDDFDVSYSESVIAWMPLPKPYKEEREKKK